jgi:signal recognition particle GTPase
MNQSHQMFGNPFIDDDEIVETKFSSKSKNNEKKSDSNIFVELEESIEYSDVKTKICTDLVKNLLCTNKKCSETGKHPSKVIICRNMMSKSKKKRKFI